jgi:hypothetical protein
MLLTRAGSNAQRLGLLRISITLGVRAIRAMNTDDLVDLLSKKTLDELLGHRFEAETLDFKEKVDLSDRRSVVELAKDVLAMANTRGGHIVVGVEDETFRIIGVQPNLAEQFKDGKTVTDKIKRYGPGAVVNLSRHDMGAIAPMSVFTRLFWAVSC